MKNISLPGSSSLMGKIWASRYLYLIFIPVVIYYLLFSYAPMFNLNTGGIFMAFTRYKLRAVFTDLEWVGLHWFKVLLSRPDFWEAFRNTLVISFGRLIFEFPAPIVLAILLNEVGRSGSKRVFQTIFTFPNFLSWVIVYGILQDMLQYTGVINTVLKSLGREPFMFLANNSMAANLTLLFGTSIWRGAGWGAIIYLASISGIDPSLYEAAKIDGASRWHCIRHITWPGIKPTAIVLLILAIGSAMNGGFDQIFQFRNAVNRPLIEILDTYVYQFGFGQGGMNQSFAVAAGLFKSVANFALLLAANRIARLLGSEGLF
ncbi:MAG: ABC transporter permease subunit [Treponema sp.]|nr:ABC transporter permease subunit [Treponema sp.]